jgi:hypothetical protein
LPTLGRAAAVVVELHPHLVLTCGDLLAAFDLEPLQAEQVVAVGRAAFLGVDAPAAERASLDEHHTCVLSSAF